ncbi:hypothetical protein [Streptomyces sp. NPDC089799]|uniref:hypothetical protein n=1 Tax=Streptomyces sp. NPDC089799 TaxID=3155066 RepID=UPI00341D53AF
MTAPSTARAGASIRLTRAAVFTAVCVVLSASGHALASCATIPWWAIGAGFLLVFALAAPLAGRRRSLPGIAAALAGGQLGLHALFGLGQHDAAAAVSAAGTGAGPMGAPSDTSLAALAAKLVCGGNSVPLRPAEARQLLEAAGIDPDAQAALAGQTAHAAHAAHAHAAPAVHAAAEPATALFSLPMLLGHLLAALVAGWLLGRGDAALFRLVELSRRSAEAGPVRALRAALGLVRALGGGLCGTDPAPRRTRRATPDRVPCPGREALQHTVIRRGPPAAYALAA